MKNTYIILMSAAITMSTAYSQNNMSFKFGLPISSAQVLLKNRTILGKTLTPTLSMGYFGLSASEEETRDGDTEKESMGGHLFIPKIGIRTLPKAPIEPTDLRRYYFTDAFTVIPIFTGDAIDKDDKEELADQIDFIGLMCGSGVEYFFSKEFSIGGEIALNVLLQSMVDEHENEDYYSNDIQTVENKLNLRAGAIFTQFTLNYYFK